MPTMTRMPLSTGGVLDCPPRFGTPRNLDRRTLGAEVAAVARLLGQPLMPAQQYVADVALEVDDDDNLIRSEINLAMMRRQGKTALMRALMVHRCRVLAKRWGPQHALYTAQTGKDARRKWDDDQVKPIDRSRYGPLGRARTPGKYGRVKLDNNDPGIFWSNGSTHRPVAPTETAAHGFEVDLGVVDEAFAHADDRVEQGFGPAMLTRRCPQLWVMSAAGTDKSAYWYRKVLRGRAMCEAGRFDGTVAYFEWSFDHPGEPYDDPETWWRRMPALGFTVTEAAIAAELDKVRQGEDVEADDEGAGDVGLERFLRPYGGVWCRIPVLTSNRQWLVLSEPQWLACADAPEGEVVPEAFGVHLSPDGTSAAVGFAASGRDGRRRIGLMWHGAGTGELLAVVARLRASHPRVPIAVNPHSDVAAVFADLAKQGALVTVGANEWAQACGALVADVVERRVEFRRQAALEAAVAAAGKRTLSGAWAWDESTGVELVAVTLALHAHRTVGSPLLFSY